MGSLLILALRTPLSFSSIFEQATCEENCPGILFSSPHLIAGGDGNGEANGEAGDGGVAPDDRVADGQRLVALGELTTVVVVDQLPPSRREEFLSSEACLI